MHGDQHHIADMKQFRNMKEERIYARAILYKKGFDFD